MSKIMDDKNLEQSIFFAAYGGGHVTAVLPVAERLASRKLPVRFLALTTAKRTLEKRGFPSLGLLDLHSAASGYRNVRRTGQLLARGQARHSAVSPGETEAYLGVGFHALVREHGLAEARRRYERVGRQTFLPVDFFLQLFRAQRPAVVVATSAPRAERAVFEAARQLGIPSVCVVDLYASSEIEWCSTPKYASVLCVLNDNVALRFTNRGVPADRVAVTGNPAFERLAQLDYPTLRRLSRAKRGLNEADRLVVWISQPEPAVHPFLGTIGDPSLPRQVETALAAYFSKHERVHLEMRPHPSEDRPCEVFGPRIRYGNVSEPLDELLCAADCIVTAGSTVGYEAAMLGVPVVQCMNSIASNDLPLAELTDAHAVAHHDEAGRVIDTILSLRTSRPPSSFVSPHVSHATALITQQVIALCPF